MPRLRVVHSGNGGLVGREFELRTPSATLGRGPDNDIIVEDSGLSRRHVRIARTPQGYLLADEGSANGVWVGDQRVGSVLLRAGVRVRAGTTVFEFVEGDTQATVRLGGPAGSPAASPPVASLAWSPAPGPASPPDGAGPAPSSRPRWGLRIVFAVLLVGAAAAGTWAVLRFGPWSQSTDEGRAGAAAPAGTARVPPAGSASAAAPGDGGAAVASGKAGLADGGQAADGGASVASGEVGLAVGAPAADGGATAVSGEIGPAGGRLEVRAPGSAGPPVRIDVPAGALDRAVAIEVRVRPGLEADAPTLIEAHPELLAAIDEHVRRVNERPGGPRLHPIWAPAVLAGAEKRLLAPPLALSPDGTRFAAPVRVALPLPADLPEDAVAEALLVIQESRGPDGVRWEVVDGVRVDRAAGTLEVDVTHFSGLWAWVVNTVKYPFRRGWMWWNDTVDRDLATLPADLMQRFTRAVLCHGEWRGRPASMPSPWETLTYLGFEGGRLTAPGERDVTAWLRDRVTRRRAGEDVRPLAVDELFAKALESTGGDVFQALVLSHNVLRDNRDSPTLQDAMAPLRGDGGDERGARYHLFGTAIYAYVHAWHTANGSWHDVIRRIVRPGLMVEAEEGVVSGDILSDSKEFAVDLVGLNLGRRLYDELGARSRGEVVQATAFDPRDCPSEPGAGAGGADGGTREFGVYVAGEHVLVGERAEIERTPCCRLALWGQDCSRTVKDAVGTLTVLAGPFGTPDEAVRTYCGMLDRSSIRHLPLAAGTQAQVSGTRYHIDNAPRCR